jgi:hypothetical protein
MREERRHSEIATCFEALDRRRCHGTLAQPWEVAVVAAVSSQRTERLPRALLAYAVALAALTLVPPSLTASVGPPTGFTLQEATDLLTPVIVIPLAWYVFDLSGGLGRMGLVAFLVIAAVWIEGQAIHLAANAVGDAVPPDAVEAFVQTAPGDLNHWLDEFLSHWLWHVGWVALSILLLAAASRAPAAPAGGVSMTAAAAGLVHGATFFVVSVEGVTTLLGIPASIVLLAWSASLARRGLAGRPVVVFFLVASIATLVGYVVWAATHGGTLPEFSKL